MPCCGQSHSFTCDLDAWYLVGEGLGGGDNGWKHARDTTFYPPPPVPPVPSKRPHGGQEPGRTGPDPIFALSRALEFVTAAEV